MTTNNTTGPIPNMGVTADIIWDRLEKLTDRMAAQSESSTKAMVEYNGLMSDLVSDMETMKNQQKSCLHLHEHKKSLCVFGDVNEEMTRKFLALNEKTNAFIDEMDKALGGHKKSHEMLVDVKNEVSKYSAETHKVMETLERHNKYLIILVAFMIVAFAALVGVKLAMPGL